MSRLPSADRADERAALVADLRARHPRASPRVLDAILHVPRHRFIPETAAHRAYQDEALAIGEGQTISQPQVVLAMTDALELHPGHRVLEVGAGSGYQAAVLSRLCAEVITIERHLPLALRAARTLRELGMDNVTVLWGDGTEGFAPRAPYDGIIITAAGEEVPQPLWNQLRPGAHLVAPVGPPDEQELVVLRRHRDGHAEHHVLFPCRFVPLVTGPVPTPPR